jgi:hypothetical protein
MIQLAESLRCCNHREKAACVIPRDAVEMDWCAHS